MTHSRDLIQGIPIVAKYGPENTEIRGLTANSREVESGYLFAALPGTKVDGHDFIDQAIAGGASLILCERVPDTTDAKITYWQVEDSVRSWALCVRNFFYDPAAEMTIVGITGTNGKTTVATLSWQLMRRLGYKAGLFSTVEVRIDDKVYSATHTTPDVLQLYRRLVEMKESGCEYVLMEVSSHALEQDRTFGIEYGLAVFTNISRDHLDYHGDFNHYINAKKKLFDGLRSTAVAIVCGDDKHSKVMLQNCPAKRVVTYGLAPANQIRGQVLESAIEGMTMKVENHEITFGLTGDFNAKNLLAVYAIVKNLVGEEGALMEKWSMLTGAEGRFDRVSGSSGTVGVVDYAHTPDALKNLLTTVDKLKQKNSQVIVVAGCGGDRDKGKRPMMGAIVSEMSDIGILTSDNPRTEDAQSIIDDMYLGVEEEHQDRIFMNIDRKEAIKMACQMAGAKDIVVVVGKGHEKYQEINGKKFPFDDKEVLQQYLK